MSSVPLRRRSLRAATSALAVLVCTAGALPPLAAKGTFPDDAPPERLTGLVRSEPGASPGVTLFCPLPSKTTYLIDMEGRVVHRWESEVDGVGVAYLLDDGRLLRAGLDEHNSFPGGGRGGVVEEFTWEGERTWEFRYSDESHLLHHDIEPLPNGNVLMIAWERKSREEALATGRDPDLLATDDFWPDHVIEVRPTRPRGGEIVWEWHAFDHLIQDHDPEKANFGDVSRHPERIDVNGDRQRVAPTEEERRHLEELGYLGAAPPRTEGAVDPGAADWNHVNAIDYHPERDEILLSVRQFHEVWVIDHATTTEEARGEKGDLLYRFGNPSAYGRGTAEDQRFFGQHDAQWIPSGFPGAGRMLVFNNGDRRPDGDFSTVDEWAPPLDEEGNYVLGEDGRFGPETLAWSHAGTPRESLFSRHVSGAQRLSNGNTLVCSGQQGRLIEVSPAGEVVWEYVNALRDPGRADKEFPDAVFRATRIPLDHPGLERLSREPVPREE